MNLCVLWELPAEGKLSSDDLILSFLSPRKEAELEKGNFTKIIPARAITDLVSEKVYIIYRNIATQIGVCKADSTKTFRERQCHKNGTSLWWFNKVSFRYSEGDLSYNLISDILTIDYVAKKYNLKKIILFGSHREIVKVLKKVYKLQSYKTKHSYTDYFVILSGIYSRLIYAKEFLSTYFIINKYYNLPLKKFDVVLSNFLGFGFNWEPETNKLKDNYFGSLFEELHLLGINSTGYFTWLSLNKNDCKNKLLRLNEINNIVILQKFLSLGELIYALLNISAFITYKIIRKKNNFRKIFFIEGLDFFTIYDKAIQKASIDSQISHCILVSNASKFAALMYKPKISLSFLEHFLYSRAFYNGINQSKTGTNNWAVQHASYNHQKTFYFLDPYYEFNGKPDNCPVPRPDKLFVMGKFGFRLFSECGYKSEQICLTGSPRYDYIKKQNTISTVSYRQENSILNVLVICSLNIEIEISMLEAVSLSFEDFANISLIVRNHPINKVTDHRNYSSLSHRFVLSNNLLAKDIENADLIIFSYSTVAEEAYIMGKIVWQWMPVGFNGSALSEVANIPQFTSVLELKTALSKFLSNRGIFSSNIYEIRKVIEELFYPADGLASKRIAEECYNYLKRE